MVALALKQWRAPVEPVIQRSRRNSRLPTPCGNALRASVMCCHSVVANVVHLFSACRPAAVSRFIVAVLVWPSIQRMKRAGARPHISIERLKARPLVTDPDAPSAVVRVALVRRGRAAVLHRRPRPILGRFRLPMREHQLVTNLRGASPCCRPPATTGTGAAVHDVGNSNDLFRPAVAPEQPACGILGNAFNGRQEVELLARNVG